MPTTPGTAAAIALACLAIGGARWFRNCTPSWHLIASETHRHYAARVSPTCATGRSPKGPEAPEQRPCSSQCGVKRTESGDGLARGSAIYSPEHAERLHPDRVGGTGRQRFRGPLARSGG